MRKLLSLLFLAIMISCGGEDDPTPAETQLQKYKNLIVGNWVPLSCEGITDHTQYPKENKYTFTSSKMSEATHCFDDPDQTVYELAYTLTMEDNKLHLQQGATHYWISTLTETSLAFEVDGTDIELKKQ